MFAQFFPALDLSPNGAPALARHMLAFMLGGLDAVGRDVREQE
jgi:hypothetical protein